MMEKTSEAYPRLYHYTDEQGLYGILNERCIWATHYKFLNDYSEIELFREKLIEFLYPFTLAFYKELILKYSIDQEFISANGGLDAMVKDGNEVFVDSCYNVLTREFYIASFCSENADEYINVNGLLSQWRAYGGDGGFAIVFKTHAFEEMLGSEGKAFRYDSLLLADVIYSDDEEKYKLELSEHLIEISAHSKEIFMEKLEEKQEPPDAEVAYPSFVQCVTRYKHRGFKEEHEVRIVAMPTVLDRSGQEIAEDEYYKSKPEKERKFRDKNGRLTPYIEFFRSLDTALPIEKIIVGPHKDKDSRAAALRIMLRNTDIEVTVSEIPYNS
jgi:hypothetical protein